MMSIQWVICGYTLCGEILYYIAIPFLPSQELPCVSVKCRWRPVSLANSPPPSPTCRYFFLVLTWHLFGRECVCECVCVCVLNNFRFSGVWATPCLVKLSWCPLPCLFFFLLSLSFSPSHHLLFWYFYCLIFPCAPKYLPSISYVIPRVYMVCSYLLWFMLYALLVFESIFSPELYYSLIQCYF